MIDPVRECFDYLRFGTTELRMGWRRFRRAYHAVHRDPQRPRKPAPRELIDQLVALQHRRAIDAARRAHPPILARMGATQ